MPNKTGEFRSDKKKDPWKADRRWGRDRTDRCQYGFDRRKVTGASPRPATVQLPHAARAKDNTPLEQAQRLLPVGPAKVMDWEKEQEEADQPR
eukprot:gene51772-55750_t